MFHEEMEMILVLLTLASACGLFVIILESHLRFYPTEDSYFSDTFEYTYTAVVVHGVIIYRASVAGSRRTMFVY